jgi:DNA polymerase-3 subunit gamma/tau
MGQALYRKYRSKSLSDIVGQEHITQTLDKAIKTNHLSHAYLFSGPKGVGKTSIARILAHDINRLPYDENEKYIDIIEIDAASNNGIDDIRDLREKVYISPYSAPYKVYIIDEVHMLSKQAFNGLLKTLEEPPAHVVFILATTEPHKLPDTIISRTQRFQFKPIEQDKVINHLKFIANQESIKINDAALQLIAAHGQGSFRDSISLLDQAANYTQPITPTTINNLIGLPPANLIDQLINYLETANTKQLILALNQLIHQGYTAPMIATNIASITRKRFIEGKFLLSSKLTLDLLANLIDVEASTQPNTYLEICLLKLIAENVQTVANTMANNVPEVTNSQAEHTTTKLAKINTEPLPNKKTTESLPSKFTNNEKSTKPKKDLINHGDNEKLDWEAVLNLLKSKHNTLYGIARMAQVDIAKDNVIRLKFAFAFHQKRVNENKNREILQKAIKQVYDRDISLECIIDQSLLTKPKQLNEEPNLDTISSVFGSSEKINE